MLSTIASIFDADPKKPSDCLEHLPEHCLQKIFFTPHHFSKKQCQIIEQRICCYLQEDPLEKLVFPKRTKPHSMFPGSKAILHDTQQQLLSNLFRRENFLIDSQGTVLCSYQKDKDSYPISNTTTINTPPCQNLFLWEELHTDILQTIFEQHHLSMEDLAKILTMLTAKNISQEQNHSDLSNVFFALCQAINKQLPAECILRLNVSQQFALMGSSNLL